MNKSRLTERTYGFLWRRHKKTPPLDGWHFNYMQEVINEPVVRGLKGIDVGSGCGYDTYIMAKNNPGVKIVSIDLSDGVYKTRELTSDLKNVRIVKCSILDMSIRNGVFDFAYSFGVLHHTNNPQKGLSEITRVLRKHSPVFVYVYEDHSENPIKYIALKIIHNLRRVTVRMPSKILYALCCIFSPFVFIIFSLPSKILGRFKTTQHFVSKIPFNFGTNLFDLRGDLYDRFSTPIEHRFSRQGVWDLFNKCGLRSINITRLIGKAGWVAWGYKE